MDSNIAFIGTDEERLRLRSIFGSDCVSLMPAFGYCCGRNTLKATTTSLHLTTPWSEVEFEQRSAWVDKFFIVCIRGVVVNTHTGVHICIYNMYTASNARTFIPSIPRQYASKWVHASILGWIHRRTPLYLEGIHSGFRVVLGSFPGLSSSMWPWDGVSLELRPACQACSRIGWIVPTRLRTGGVSAGRWKEGATWRRNVSFAPATWRNQQAFSIVDSTAEFEKEKPIRHLRQVFTYLRVTWRDFGWFREPEITFA